MGLQPLAAGRGTPLILSSCAPPLAGAPSRTGLLRALPFPSTIPSTRLGEGWLQAVWPLCPFGGGLGRGRAGAEPWQRGGPCVPQEPLPHIHGCRGTRGYSESWSSRAEVGMCVGRLDAGFRAWVRVCAEPREAEAEGAPVWVRWGLGWRCWAGFPT